MMHHVSYRFITIDGIRIFYRELGNPANPAIVLLHGFPSSSHMYRDLMKRLSAHYYLIAPDYPAFGYSDMPPRSVYEYTFDNLSKTVEKFIEKIGLNRFVLYMQDYGAPVGFRIAVRRPEWIQALIIQNANAYLAGLGPAMEEGKRFWAGRNSETEAAMRRFLTLAGTRFQYLDGVLHPERVSPDAYYLDQYFLDREGAADIQLDLLYDYRNNLTQYPSWQKFLRTHQPPALIPWGRNDKFFTAAGAVAYRDDLEDAEVHLFDTGHFALEEFHSEIAALINEFLDKRRVLFSVAG